MDGLEDFSLCPDWAAVGFDKESPVQLAGPLALIVRRALDPAAGDSVVSRRLRVLYQRARLQGRPDADSQAVFLRLLAEILASGPRRASPQGPQDSRVVEDTWIG